MMLLYNTIFDMLLVKSQLTVSEFMKGVKTTFAKESKNKLSKCKLWL